mgnify:CR=1 FL=1
MANLDAKLKLNTDDLKKGLSDAGDRVKALGSKFDALASSVLQIGAQGPAGFANLAKSLGKTGTIAAGVGATLAGILVATKAIAKTANLKEGVINLGVTPSEIDAVSKALGGTVDQVTLLSSIKGALLSGADAGQMERMAKSAAFLAKQIGISKQEALDLVASGSLSDAMLQRLGISAQKIANNIAKEETKISGQASETTRQKIRMNAILGAIQKKSKNFSASTKQAGDEAARVNTAFKDASEKLGREMLPYLTKAVKLMTSVSRAAGPVASGFKSFGQSIGEGAARSWLWLTGKQAKVDALDNLETTQKALKTYAKARGQITKKALTKEQIASQRAIAEKARKEREARAEATRQYLEDLRQRQEQAKDLLRNYTEQSVKSIGDMGGSFGTVASALTDVFEKTRIFASMPKLLKSINVAIQVAAETQGKKNVDIAKEIGLRAKALKLTDKQEKAAKLLGTWIQGGASDSLEFLSNERAANAQLKAGLSTLASSAKMAQLRVEQGNLFKDVTQFQAGADQTINALLVRRKKLIKQNTEASKSRAGVIDLIITRLRRTSVQFGQIAKERQRILAISQQQLAIERKLELSQQRLANQQMIRGAKNSVAQQRLALLQAQGRNTTGAGIELAGQQRVQGLRDQMSQMGAQANALVNRLGGLGQQEQQALVSKIEALRTTIELKQKELELTQQTTKAQVHGLTLAGQLQKAFAFDAVKFAAQIAQNVKSSIDGLVGGMTNAIAGFVQGAIQGDQDIGANFGKATLDALGNLALQWGSMFALQGAGMLAGFMPSGAAVLAAGVGLTALGGALKGASGLIGAGAPTQGSAAATGPQFERIPGTEPDGGKNTRETVVIINDTPWSRKSSQNYRDMVQWATRESRMTGKPLAMGVR